MSSIEKHLMSGETMVQETRLHWIVYLPAILVGAVAVGLGIWSTRLGQELREVLEIAALLFALCGLYLALTAMIRRASARFAVTNKRVLIKLGLIRHRSVEILLSQIEGITVTQDFWGRVFNYGTVVIEGTGGDAEPYPMIAGPIAFRLAVQEQIEHYTQRGAGPAPPPPPPDRYADLAKLNELRKSGALTEEEYQIEKQKLLNRAT